MEAPAPVFFCRRFDLLGARLIALINTMAMASLPEMQQALADLLVVSRYRSIRGAPLT